MDRQREVLIWINADDVVPVIRKLANMNDLLKRMARSL